MSGTRGHLTPIIFARTVRPMNALQHCPWQFSHRCYGWGATGENRAKIDDFAPTPSLWSKISGTRGCPPAITFARLVRQWMPYTLPLTVFTQRNYAADFLQAKSDFLRKSAVLCFWDPRGGLIGATYDDHLRLIGKHVVDFLLALIELFSLGVTERRYERLSVQNRRFCFNGGGWPNISGRMGRPPPTILLLRKLG